MEVMRDSRSPSSRHLRWRVPEAEFAAHALAAAESLAADSQTFAADSPPFAADSLAAAESLAAESLAAESLAAAEAGMQPVAQVLNHAQLAAPRL